MIMIKVVQMRYKLDWFGSSETKTLKKRQRESNMSLEDRLKLESKKFISQIGETRRSNVKGGGAVREVTYIPKDVQARKERAKYIDRSFIKVAQTRRLLRR